MTPHTNQVVPVEPTPCPFCGSNNISCGEVLGEYPTGRTYSQSMCYQCKALGPEAELEEGEIDYGDVKANVAWNRRAAAPQQQGELVYQYRYRSQTAWVDCSKEDYARYATYGECETRILYTQPITADASFNQGIEAAVGVCEANKYDLDVCVGCDDAEIADAINDELGKVATAILSLKRPTDMVTITRAGLSRLVTAFENVVGARDRAGWLGEILDTLSDADALDDDQIESLVASINGAVVEGKQALEEFSRALEGK